MKLIIIRKQNGFDWRAMDGCSCFAQGHEANKSKRKEAWSKQRKEVINRAKIT